MWDKNRARDRLREVLGGPGWSWRAWRGPGQRARKSAPSQRQWRWPWMAARVAAAVAVVAVPVGTGALTAAPAPAALRPAAGPTVYAAFSGTPTCQKPGCAALIPISTATNKTEKPIKVGHGPTSTWGGAGIAITPDGKTAYAVTSDNVVVPISTATNSVGKPIRLGSDCRLVGSLPGETFDNIVFTPDGKTVYVTCGSAVVPISTATNTPGKPIRPGPFEIPQTIAITP